MPLLKYIFLISSLVAFSFVTAQDSVYVKWNVTSKKITNKQFEIKLAGEIKQNWHIYSQPNVTEGLNGLQITYADSSINQEKYNLKGNVTSIPDPIFNIQAEVATGLLEVTQKITFTGEEPPALDIQLSYEVADKDNFIPEEQKLNIILDSIAATALPKNRMLIPSINLAKPLTDCGASSAISRTSEDNSLLNLFLLGFIGGLIALLTPCVFPMIPLTVSFFTKKSATKKSGISNAFIYGLFIFLIYILLSLPFHFLDKLNPEILNNISTNVFLNVFFFAIFIFFAFSFFGFYEISLPSGLSSKADSKAGAGNIAGIFFMALTLAIVSFSCTGPILGSLLA